MLAALVASMAVLGCEGGPQPAVASDAGASPNASILPAPLATEPPDLFEGGAAVEDGGGRPTPLDPPLSSSRPSSFDAGAPLPESMRPGAPVPADIPFQRDSPGVSLDAVFRWRDIPSPPRAPEVSAEGLREAQKLTAPSLKIDLSEGGRMRAELTGAAFPLAAHTELRARSDHYGNLVVWPDGRGYRVIPPGALRTVLGERRMDVTPLSPGLAAGP